MPMCFVVDLLVESVIRTPKFLLLVTVTHLFNLLYYYIYFITFKAFVTCNARKVSSYG